MMDDIKTLVRPFLAGFWSVASVVTFWITGLTPPPWMLGLTLTCVLWFFGSREKEKANAKKAL